MWNTILYQPLLNLLIIFYNYLGHNMGVAIIAVTVLVRFILYPLTRRTLVVQKKMKDLQPHLEKIKKDHGHDKQKLTKATMDLYKQHGVSPFSSCLPLLIQFPLFIALYQVFFKLNQFPNQVNNLYHFVHRPVSINTHFLWFDLTKPDHLYILPILAGLSLFWQTKMMQPQTQQPKTNGKGGQMEQFQQMLSGQMMYIFPLMTVFIALRLPTALALYWIITTVFGIIQQYIVMKEGGIPTPSDGVKSKGSRGTVLTVKKRE